MLVRRSSGRRIIVFPPLFLPVNTQTVPTNPQPQVRWLRSERNPILKSSLMGATVALALLEKQPLALWA
jgi:hypothetical protein